MDTLTERELDLLSRTVEIDDVLTVISDTVNRACKSGRESEIQLLEMILTKYKLEIDLLIHALSVHTQYTKIQDKLSALVYAKIDAEEDDK